MTDGFPSTPPRVLDHPAAAEHWPELDRLLDEALDLDEEARAAWLAALPPSPHKDWLARLLGGSANGMRSAETNDFLGALPPLSPAGLRNLVDEAGAAALKPGDEVGPWRIVRELGQGGMASVWLAERSDGTLKRQVALKLPHAAWAPGLAARLLRERDILATLEHPHIARLYDAGLDAQGRPWLALEYVQGRPIDEYVRAEGCDTRTRVQLLVQVAQAVAYAHSRLVIHRDLKPPNILVSADAQVHLLDFGIAKLMRGELAEDSALTRDAGRALTPDYASPEQVAGDTLTTASDVYSLGVVAFELLAGARPYRLERGTAAELEQAIASAAAPLASDVAEGDAARRLLRGDLDAILNKALKKRPAERYATVDAMAQDLARTLRGEKVAARPDTLAYRARRFAVRERRPLAAGAAVAVAFGLALGAGATALVIAALALGLAAALWQARRARAKAREARQQAARAQAVQRFLLDIFNANTDRQPDAAQARQATARDLLDRGAARAESALADAPQARIEVMGTLAQMYYQLSHFEPAAALQQRLVQLVRQWHGEDSRRVAQALIELANIRMHIEPGPQVLPLLHEAKALLDSPGHDPVDDTGPALRGRLLANLAKCHFKISMPKALEHAEEAMRVLGAGPQADSVHLTTALQVAGVARIELGDLPAGEAHLRRALALLKAMPSVPQVALAQVASTLGDCLALQHRHAEALALAQETQRNAVAALGELDINALFVSARLGARLHAAGRRDEGRALLRGALDTLSRRPEAGDPVFLSDTQRQLGWALFEEGDIEPARALLDTAVAATRRVFTGTVAARALRQLALVHAAAGDIESAAGLFDEALATWRQGAGEAIHGWRINRLLLAHAAFELDRGRPAAASARLADWVPRPGPALPLPADEFERDLLRSRLHGAEGDTAAALALAQATAEAVAASPAPRELPVLWVQAQEQLARALLAAGRASEAGAPARAAALWRRRHDAATSPWAAEAENLLASVEDQARPAAPP